jgi:hypothetical protein
VHRRSPFRLGHPRWAYPEGTGGQKSDPPASVIFFTTFRFYLVKIPAAGRRSAPSLPENQTSIFKEHMLNGIGVAAKSVSYVFSSRIFSAML